MTCVASACLSATAMIRPLEPAELQASASDVVVAQAISVKGSVKRHGFLGRSGSDDVQLVTFRVQATVKGSTYKVGDTFTLRLWEIRRRPNGWAGGQGTGRVSLDGVYRLYLYRDASGELIPVIPNGLQPADAIAPQP